MSVPKDPLILFSFINTRLRDSALTLPQLCAELDICEKELCAALAGAGYRYDAAQRRFV